MVELEQSRAASAAKADEENKTRQRDHEEHMDRLEKLLEYVLMEERRRKASAKKTRHQVTTMDSMDRMDVDDGDPHTELETAKHGKTQSDKTTTSRQVSQREGVMEATSLLVQK